MHPYMTVKTKYQDLQEFIKSLNLSSQDQEMMHYNLEGGKFIRKYIFQQTLKCLLPSKPTTIYDKIGWCIELLQAFYLITDDIIDNSLVRRGKPAWYKIRGLTAIHDALKIHFYIYKILETFEDHPKYYEILQLFNYVECVTWTGQCQDDLPRSFIDINDEYYKDQVRTKTSYYTFVLPVHLAHLVAMKEYKESCNNVMLDLGYLYQFQDDYLNFYPDKANKSGTDLEEKKVTWFIIQLLKDGKDEMVKRYIETGDYNEVRKEIDVYLRSYDEIVNGMKNKIYSCCHEEDKVYVEEIVNVIVKRSN